MTPAAGASLGAALDALGPLAHGPIAGRIAAASATLALLAAALGAGPFCPGCCAERFGRFASSSGRAPHRRRPGRASTAAGGPGRVPRPLTEIGVAFAAPAALEGLTDFMHPVMAEDQAF